jgi:phage pi2 protein 07
MAISSNEDILRRYQQQAQVQAQGALNVHPNVLNENNCVVKAYRIMNGILVFYPATNTTYYCKDEKELAEQVIANTARSRIGADEANIGIGVSTLSTFGVANSRI